MGVVNRCQRRRMPGEPLRQEEIAGSLVDGGDGAVGSSRSILASFQERNRLSFPYGTMKAC